MRDTEPPEVPALVGGVPWLGDLSALFQPKPLSDSDKYLLFHGLTASLELPAAHVVPGTGEIPEARGSPHSAVISVALPSCPVPHQDEAVFQQPLGSSRGALAVLGWPVP